MDQQIDFLLDAMQNNIDSPALEIYNCVLSSNLKRGTIKFNPISLSDVLDLGRVFFEQLKEQSHILDIFTSVVQQTITFTKNNVAFGVCSKFITEMSKEFVTPPDSILFLRFVHQILRAFEVSEDEEPIPLADDFVDFVISGLFSDDKDVRLWSFMCANCLVKDLKCNEMLSKIWERLKNSKGEAISLDILAQFIDSFLEILNIYADPVFWGIILNALINRGVASDEKKRVLYILDKLLEYISTEQVNSRIFVDGYFEWDPQDSEMHHRSWRALITILANLEEKQSHLILPSLEMLEKVKVPFFWKEVLLADLLTQKNSLVLKNVIEYVLKKYNCLNLSSKTLQYLMEAMNNTYLYVKNPEFLKAAKTSFVDDVPRILGIFCLINWKPVPMHALLTALESAKSDTDVVPPAILMEISACIRLIQNKDIRNKLRKQFFEMFKNDLQEVSLYEFFNICTTLNNKIGSLETSGSTILKNKLSDCTEDRNLQLNHLEIVLKANVHAEDKTKCLREFINSVDPEDLLPVLEMTTDDSIDNDILPELAELLEDNAEMLEDYDVIMNSEQYFTQLLVKIFKNDFEPWKFEEDFESLRSHLINQDVNRLENLFIEIYFDSIAKGQRSRFIDKSCFNWLFLRAKGKAIKSGFSALAEIRFLAVKEADALEQLKEAVQECGIPECEKMFKDYLNYLTRMGREEFFQGVTEILNFDRNTAVVLKVVFNALRANISSTTTAVEKPDRFFSDQDFLVDLFIDGLLFGKPLIGDQKTEFDYCLQNDIPLSDGNADEVRYMVLQLLQKIHCQCPNDAKIFFGNLRNKLLNISNIMSTRKTRYFGDSMHHRQKLRIVQALAKIQSLDGVWDKRFLDIVFKENNQTNVTYIGEFLIAAGITRYVLIELLHKAKELTPSSLCSLFPITYLACQRIDDSSLTTICMKLIAPWTMGANFQVRTNAQVALYHMYKNLIVNKPEIEKLKISHLYHAIEETLKQGTVEENLKKDFRYNNLNGLELLEEGNILVHIPRITNMASDELYRHFESVDQSTLASVKEKIERIKDRLQESNNSVEKVQKKMNPIQFDLDSAIEHTSLDNLDEQCKMIVVASLISKAPNLGGIARTCEVLGINNLILDSLKHVKCKEFQSLSMTAEKWLNIQEVKPEKLQSYLIDRKLQNYSIVGAEQTSNSVNFVDFKFPDKCVLLLGQEKEGIPANLLSLMDFAVEIPQLGMVRSLNVHVTGALFMWEYFKQHKHKRNGKRIFAPATVKEE